MRKLIVGINGLAQHGKDTCASFLKEAVEAKGFTCEIMAFATPIKEVAKYVFDLPEEALNTSAGKKLVYPTTYGMTSREIMQKLGTEAFREVFSQTVWPDFLARAAAKSEADVIAIPDMRFDNEIQFVKGLPTTHAWSQSTMKVFNPNVTPQAPAHQSEVPQSDVKFDAVIVNGLGLAELKQAVEDWAGELILPRLYA